MAPALHFTLAVAAILVRTCTAEPSSWALWGVKVHIPADVSVRKATRGSDSGWGVDLNLSTGVVGAAVWDDDGDAFFELRRGGASCKVSVGSNGLGPGLEVEIFQQRGLDCNVVKSAGGPKDFVLSLSAGTELDGTGDCDSTFCPDGACPESQKQHLCGKTWRAPPADPQTQTPLKAKPSSWALWTAEISLPVNTSVHRARRGSDHGWGVDLNVSAGAVNANVWDDDGDAFFIVKRGNASCKVSVGSNGLGPGLEVEIFQQRGLDCNVVKSAGGPKDFVLSLSAGTELDGTADCDSTFCPDGACPESEKQHLCGKTWRAPPADPQTQTWLKAKPSSWALWTAKISLPVDTSVHKARRGSDHGWGVDLNVSADAVDANVWDDDGDAFLLLRRGHASCKVSVGSNGLAPGLEVEIFQQRGLDCNVVQSAGGPREFVLTLGAETMLDGTADCDSTTCPDGACPESEKGNLCNNTWRPSPSTQLLVV